MTENDNAAEKAMLKEAFKDAMKDGVFKAMFKEVVTEVIEDIIDYCGRWTLKCLAGAALVGIIWLGLIGSGWKK